jgi:hypothetical protein
MNAEWGWKISSYSTGANNCIETASAGCVVGVRDTKDRDRGIVAVGAPAWARFVASLKSDC